MSKENIWATVVVASIIILCSSAIFIVVWLSNNPCMEISTDKYHKGWDDGYQSAKEDSFDAYLYSTGINSCQYFLKCIGCNVDCNGYFKEYPSECFKNIEEQIQQEGGGKK
jgi:hypothetical protein